jgi:L-ornithine Nalpha-acyltransferase
LENIIEKICHPAILIEDDHFLIKFAESAMEVKAAQALRYRVFYLEQGRGESSIDPAGIDVDKFDEFCLHLVVVEKTNNKIVGTYRVHPGTVAKANLGLYTATEYDLEGIDNIIDDVIEVGRSCVCPHYRNGAVVALLWAGLAQTMVRGDFRFLLGCVSLETSEPAVGWALHEYLCNRGQITDTIIAKPKSNFILDKVAQEDIDRLTATPMRKHIPPLFRGYVRLGAKICGKPVFDRDFGTIDFLILVDLELMPEKYFKHFKMRQCYTCRNNI